MKPTFAMLSEPRCLDLAVFSLPPPRPLPVPAGAGPTAWRSTAAPPGGTLGFRDAAVRECLDTVAVLRAYREPLPTEHWTLSETGVD